MFMPAFPVSSQGLYATGSTSLCQLRRTVHIFFFSFSLKCSATLIWQSRWWRPSTIVSMPTFEGATLTKLRHCSCCGISSTVATNSVYIFSPFACSSSGGGCTGSLVAPLTYLAYDFPSYVLMSTMGALWPESWFRD